MLQTFWAPVGPELPKLVRLELQQLVLYDGYNDTYCMCICIDGCAYIPELWACNSNNLWFMTLVPILNFCHKSSYTYLYPN